MSTRSLFWLALALFPSGLASSQATVFLSGTPAGVGDVGVISAPGQAPSLPPQLQGIVLLPIDAAGRTSFTQFLPDQPRLKSDLPGASRLLLPHGMGCLYRYRRDRSGGADFGFFLVGPDGMAQFLASFPGGPGNGDPIPNPIAVSSDGDAILVATTLLAGGDLFEIELATGTILSVTAGLPPLDILPRGLALLPSWGTALTAHGPLRFVRGGGRPLLVPLHPRVQTGRIGHNPANPTASPLTFFGNGVAVSADGSTVAVIAGTSPSQAHVFTFGLAGPAVCVNDTAASIADPGFGTEAGPNLALSPDGRRAAWKTVGVSGECFTRRVPVQPTPPEYQITADGNFDDTLNDTGVIAFFDPDSVVMLVGEANGVGGIEHADLYRTQFPIGGGSPAFTNLSNTSGDGVAPFVFKGDIETTDGLFEIPGKNGAVYFVPGSSGQGEIYRLDGTTGTAQLLRSGVDALELIERAGSSFVLGILNDQPAQRELLAVPFDHTRPATSLGLFPGTSTFFTHAGSLGGTFAGTLNVTGGQQIFQVFVPSGSGTLWPDVLQYGPVLGFDPSGAALTSIHNNRTSYFASWALGGSGTLYGSGPVQSLVLPAN